MSLPGGMVRAAACATAWLLPVAPALAQRLGQGTGAEVPVWRVLGALLLCLALAVAAAYILRRRMNGVMPRSLRGAERRLQLVETMRLSHQVDLCIVRCDGRELLVAATPHGATALAADLSGPPAPADEDPQ